MSDLLQAIKEAHIQLARAIAHLVLAQKARTEKEKNKHIDAALDRLGIQKRMEEGKITTNNTYILKLELRYSVTIIDCDGNSDTGYKTKKIFLGAFIDIDDAVNYGNETLDEMESMFQKMGARSFNTKFGLPIQTNMGYLKTPFQFFLTIDRYVHGNVKEILKETLEEVK